MAAVRVWMLMPVREISRHIVLFCHSRVGAHHRDMGRGSFGTPRGRPDANAMAAQLEGLPRKDSQVDEPNSASSAAAVTTGAAVSGTRGDGGAAAGLARGASSTTSGAPARRCSAAAIQDGLVAVAIAPRSCRGSLAEANSSSTGFCSLSLTPQHLGFDTLGVAVRSPPDAEAGPVEVWF